MSIDSFGFQVMSLEELIARLQECAERDPSLLNKPVWTANMHPLHFPVKAVVRDERGTHLSFERGGN